MADSEKKNPIARTVFTLFTDFWSKYPPETQWQMLLMGDDPALRRYRHILALLPANPRCQFCYAPLTASTWWRPIS